MRISDWSSDVCSSDLLLALALWSVARRWRYPDAWPAAFSLETWAGQAPEAAAIAGTTLTTGVVAAGIALVLALGCLENEQRRGVTLTNRADRKSTRLNSSH